MGFNSAFKGLNDSFSPFDHTLSLTFLGEFNIFLNTNIFLKHNWQIKNTFLLELFHKHQFCLKTHRVCNLAHQSHEQHTMICIASWHNITKIFNDFFLWEMFGVCTIQFVYNVQQRFSWKQRTFYASFRRSSLTDHAFSLINTPTAVFLNLCDTAARQILLTCIRLTTGVNLLTPSDSWRHHNGDWHVWAQNAERVGDGPYIRRGAD